MTILSFRNKKDKEMLYEKARKMEEYASMIVDCLEDAGYGDNYDEDYKGYSRMYRDHEESHEEQHPEGRYNYRRMK